MAMGTAASRRKRKALRAARKAREASEVRADCVPFCAAPPLFVLSSWRARGELLAKAWLWSPRKGRCPRRLLARSTAPAAPHDCRSTARRRRRDCLRVAGCHLPRRHAGELAGFGAHRAWASAASPRSQQSSRTRQLNDEGRKISGGSRTLKGTTDFTAVRASSRVPRKQGWNSINGLTQDPSGLAKSLRLPRSVGSYQKRSASRY